MPGLLAGLALRYDASRAVDMNGRAQAAGAAMHRTLALLKVRCSYWVLALPSGPQNRFHGAYAVAVINLDAQ